MTHIPSRPVPTTFEYIEAIALRDPQRLALAQQDQAWSYQSFYLDLVRVTRVLDALGVRRGDRVAVGLSGFQANMVLLIAAENVGAVTAAFIAESDVDSPALFALVDWVFSDLPQEVPPSARFVRVDESFLEQVRRADPNQPAPYSRVAPEPHEPQRIVRTSGSSGRSKLMVLTRQAQEHWVRNARHNGGYQPDTRLLAAGPLVMNAVFSRCCACLRLGAAVLDPLRGTIAGRDVTHILALPALLEEMLNALPAGYSPREPIRVITLGGFLSPQLRERAARVFRSPVASRYGANEVCGICEDLDASGCGVISAGVDVRVLDDGGNDLPHGQLGIIAVRTPGMADGYLGDEAATRAAFRDGWFISGDWGTLVGPRVLRLAGRHDELINVGGIKLPAADIEEQVRKITQAACATLAVNLDAGATTIGIALVDDGRTPRAEVREKIARELKLVASTMVKVIFLPAIPRLASGKNDRMALHRLFEAPPPECL